MEARALHASLDVEDLHEGALASFSTWKQQRPSSRRWGKETTRRPAASGSWVSTADGDVADAG